MARGQYAHLPWEQQPQVLTNPNFPYAKDYPLIEGEGEAHVFQVGSRIRTKTTINTGDWFHSTYGGSRPEFTYGRWSYMVIHTRRLKRYRRDDWTYQVMLDVMPGRWFAAAHFVSDHGLRIVG